MSLASFSTALSNTVFLSLVAGIPLYGIIKKVKIYDTFVEGGKEGFQIAVKIIPYLVAMIVAIGMVRASGAFELMGSVLAPVLKFLHVPTDVLTLAIMRPFSGSASNGLLAEIIHTYGPNSFAAQVASTIMGSTETTFFVIAVYFGAVAIKRTRHAIPAGLIADTVGVIASVLICHWLFL